MRESLRDKAARIGRLPNVLLFVDYGAVLTATRSLRRDDWVEYLREELPQRLVSVAIDLGKIRASTVYATQVEAPQHLWSRYGFALQRRESMEIDVIEQVLTRDPAPQNVIIVSDKSDLAELTRRVRNHVEMVAVVAPIGVDESLKRSANLFVPIHTVVEDESLAEDVPTRMLQIIEKLQKQLPYVGVSFLLRSAMPTNRVGTKEAGKVLDGLVALGAVEIYQHEKGERACRLVAAGDRGAA